MFLQLFLALLTFLFLLLQFAFDLGRNITSLKTNKHAITITVKTMKFHPHTYHLCCIRLIKSAFTSTEMSGKDVSSLTACKNSTNQTFLNEANLFDSLLHDVHIFPWYLARLIERQALFYLFTQLVAKHVRGHVCKKTSKTSAQYKEIEGRQKAHLCP